MGADPTDSSNGVPSTEQQATEPRLDTVLDTAQSFDVCGFGCVRGVTTTHLTGALIGRRLNNLWRLTMLSSQGDIVGFAPHFPWPTGAAPALIVRSLADGSFMAFQLDDVWRCLPASGKLRAAKERAVLELRARVQQIWMDSPQPHLAPPTLPGGRSGAIDHELRRLTKVEWLSLRDGCMWQGTEEQLDAAFNRAYDALRDRSARAPRSRADDDNARRVRQRQEESQNSLYARAATAIARAQRRHSITRAARNVAAMLAYNQAAHLDARPLDLGRLGGCAICEGDVCMHSGDHASQRLMCTYCGALLFRGEAKRCQPRPPFDTVSEWQWGVASPPI